MHMLMRYYQGDRRRRGGGGGGEEGEEEGEETHMAVFYKGKQSSIVYLN